MKLILMNIFYLEFLMSFIASFAKYKTLEIQKEILLKKLQFLLNMLILES